ncbi:hypothetical protein EG835_06940, partial [bacterium]|nr:hypothetical protein [bacterium]
MNTQSSAGTGERMQWIAVGIGSGVGLVFPLIAGLLVEPKSTLSLVIFWVLSVGAGAAVGGVAYLLSRQAVDRSLRGVLESATRNLGFTAADAGDAAAINAEIERIFAAAAALLGQIRDATDNIRAVTSDVLAATEQQASGAAQQAAAVTETSATVEELAQTSSQIADNAGSVVRIAEKTLASAEEGMLAVATTAAGIEEIRETTMQSSDRILALGERSQEIGRVLSIINEIAEQTKI